MSKRERVESAFWGYNSLLAEGGLQPYSQYALPKLQPAIWDFLQWCSAHRVDPMPYARGRLEASGWANRIPFNRLKSEKFVKTHQGFHEARQGQQVYAGYRAPAPDTSVAGTELHVLAEKAKEMYARMSSSKLCRLEAPYLTLGWNPNSRWCQRCPEATECRAALPSAILRNRSTCAS